MTATGDIVIGLDAGTTVVKAVAFDLGGRQIDCAGTRNRFTRGDDGVSVEQDPLLTWESTIDVLQKLAERVPDLARRAVALAVTGQGDGTFLIDRDGTPVAPGWLWLDGRSAGIVRELEASGARAEMFKTTGCGMNGSNQSGHLVWLDRERPDLLDRTHFACHCKDWLYYKLTGERCTDVSEATFTFGDYRRRTYDDGVIATLGLSHRRGLLPPIVDSLRGEHHLLSAEAAKATGLPAGLPVVLGYVDVVCTGLAGGLYDRDGRVGVSIVGSTGMHMRFVPDVEAMTLGEDVSGYVMQLEAGTAARMQSNMAATINIDWLLQLTRQAAELIGHAFDYEKTLAAFEAAVSREPPGQAIYHPYIDRAGERGPFVNPQARAQIVGLSNAVSFAGIARSIYEGLAFAARDCFTSIGGAPGELRLAGGAARSDVLKRIFACVLDRPVRESTREEAGAAGAAMMALVSLGQTKNLAEAADIYVTPTLGGLIEPVARDAALYGDLFAVYADLRERMPPAWQALAEARAKASAGGPLHA